MEKFYKIMSDILKTEYQIKAAVCVLEALEAAYSEDTQIEIKSLAAVTKGYLKTVESDTRQIIDYIDTITAERKTD